MREQTREQTREHGCYLRNRAPKSREQTREQTRGHGCSVRKRAPKNERTNERTRENKEGRQAAFGALRKRGPPKQARAHRHAHTYSLPPRHTLSSPCFRGMRYIHIYIYIHTPKMNKKGDESEQSTVKSNPCDQQKDE